MLDLRHFSTMILMVIVCFQVFFSTIPGQRPGGNICTISTSLFNKLFPSGDLDAIKTSMKPKTEFRPRTVFHKN